MARHVRRGLAAGIIGLSMAAAEASAGGWSISLGVGFAFGGGCGGGWGGPVVSLGTTWYSGGGCYSPCYNGYYGGGYYGGGYYGGGCAPYYRGGYCGSGYYGGYPCSTYVAPRYCAPSYSSGGSYYAAAQPAPYTPQASVASVRMAAAPRPVAPAAPAETNTARGWRLMESEDAGAMEAFGRAIARSESADAYLGYAICAARAGQTGRAEWAARTALKKDAQVLAKAPAGKGVKSAAADALASYTRKTRGLGEAAEFTVAVLSNAAGDSKGAAESASKLVGGDEATTRLVAAVGAVRTFESPEKAKPVGAGAGLVEASRPTASIAARRVVVAVKPDTR